MLQNWESQQKLLVRNRILIIFSVTLLAVSLTYFIIFITIQMRTLRQSRRDQQKQEATLALFQRFLDTDRRFSTVKDSEGRLIFVNSAFTETHRTSRDELIGKRLCDLIEVKIASSLDTMDRHIIDTGQSTEIVETYDDVTLKIAKFPLTLPDGSPGIGTLGSDITEQIRVERMLREEELRESRRSLRLLLDSTAEGIFGMDSEGKCTFVNASTLSLLGYEREDELLFQNVHSLIHHTGSDGLAQSSEECPILSTIKSGTGLVMENEIFWRKDGTSFDVLAYAYPQLQDGTIVGAVVTFTDNTERKSAQERITYLSLHDQLTGLYNRAYFDQALAEAQRRVILPYSVIVGDVNGLKLTNDIFGHSAGDELLVTIARTLSIHCPPRATISRVGGDEFVILLPHFSQQQSVQLMDQIRASMERENILGGRQAIALGAATRSSAEEPMLEIFDQAEDWMYRQKVLRLRETQHHQLQVLIQVLFDKAPDEEIHALRVQAHALAIGTMLGLDTETMGLLGRAAYYHDIGKLVLDPDLIATKGREASQRRTYQSHVSAGYRILNTFEETMDLAPYVLHHHEWYNGKGYLKGLAGKEIPYLSRILRLAEIWEREGVELKEKEYKILTLQRVAGVEADPQMVERIIASL
ncbi:MAG TPA: diguanylate cyclase [Sphaerochaeta sp.]|nr:diguanylate cyclase [Sphaerochaeta sp.]